MAKMDSGERAQVCRCTCVIRFALPVSHLARIGGAMAAMMGVLAFLPKSADLAGLAGLICARGAAYALALAAVYPGETGDARGRLKRLRQT